VVSLHDFKKDELWIEAEHRWGWDDNVSYEALSYV
jgi:hypothetical protein